MKFLLVLVFVLNLYGDEIQRINSIVSDITKLRVDYKKSQEELRIYKDKVKNLEKELKRTRNLLKTKQKSIEHIVVNDVNYGKIQTNTFPKLKMRVKTIHTKASVFRLNKNAFIYNNINGVKIDEWEKSTSFTSNQRSEKFIRITGFFKNRQWIKAEKSLWVKVEDALKRDKK